MPNPIDLLTLDDLKKRLGVEPSITAEDDDLQRLITQTSADFLNTISRKALFTADYTETRNGYGGNVMVMENTPVRAVASLRIGLRDVPLSVNGSPGYVFDANAIMLNGWIFPKGYGNVVVQYTAGLGTGLDDTEFPQEIVLAVLDWCVLRYKQRQTEGVSSKHMATGESITYDKRVMPDTTRRCAQSYKRRTWVR